MESSERLHDRAGRPRRSGKDVKNHLVEMKEHLKKRRSETAGSTPLDGVDLLDADGRWPVDDGQRTLCIIRCC